MQPVPPCCHIIGNLAAKLRSKVNGGSLAPHIILLLLLGLHPCVCQCGEAFAIDSGRERQKGDVAKARQVNCDWY